MQLLAIIIGAILGALGRFALTGLAHKVLGAVFPVGTLVVNCLGSFLIGFFWALFSETYIQPAWRGFLFIGLLGSFTTFSSYSLETFNLLQEGEIRLALMNIALQNVLGIGLAIGGFFLGKFIT